MAFRQHTCVIVACDVCGNAATPDGDVPHFDTQAEALAHLAADPDYYANTWHRRPNGLLVCWVRDAVHDRAREQDGMGAPGPDAMTVSFSDKEAQPWP
ncbi:hypothetical protein ACWY4P_40730 [Streptomyces sp. LZ34]